MKSKKLKAAICLAAGYFLLLILMVYAESFSPDASITSIPEAIWYSFVTMTTVGYGDLFPVTTAGKLIGIFFLLLSAGALTALISLGVTWLNGTGLPTMLLRRIKNKKVYIFEGMDHASKALCDSILAEDKNALCIFSCEESRRLDAQTLQVTMDIPDILNCLPALPEKPTVISLGQSHCNLENIQDANIVCQSQLVPQQLKDGQHYFDRDDLCSCMYWQRYPLRFQEKTVVLVGIGHLGRKLLEYALENCVLSPIRTTQYHVFHLSENFLNDHPMLNATVSIGTASDSCDSLFIHDGLWNQDPELLINADRIIFCSDNQEENLSLFQRLNTYFPVTGKVHLYSTAQNGADIPAFGTDEEVYTPETVLREGLEQMAKNMHAIYCDQCGPGADPWEKLSPFLRRSNFASAQHLNEKLRYLLEDDSLTSFTAEQLRQAHKRFLELRSQDPTVCRRIEHDRWMRFHSMYNWHYAPVRCNPKREHPLMVAFDSLCEKEQAKDDYAWELIEKLAEKAEL